MGCGGSYVWRSFFNPSSLKMNWWRKLWKIKVPLKIMNFIWRACHDWIPTRGNLDNRGIPIEMWCPMCYKTLETTIQALWGCSQLKNIGRACLWIKELGIHHPASNRGENVIEWASEYLTDFKEATEAAAILQGLRTSIEHNLLPAVLESDSMKVVNLINSGSCPLSDIGVIISDIMVLLRQFNLYFYCSKEC
ncbi:hypothetical protein Ddye_029647 [Dipteronia dyeriana]|uniref:Reverse transcriptase zinc-binding domain-containing protein n=1 Tax=Dipteronia dyeriana TaxID=168575 RepID=A0AAD9TG35_9ROSI|nr:hypothetical protein Ddye_029647 [Dipteronia dyeriana]